MARAECARCGIMFAGVTAFDEHLLEGGSVHVHPSGVKRLVQRDNGTWGFKPMTPEALARLHRGRDGAQEPAEPGPLPDVPPGAENGSWHEPGAFNGHSGGSGGT